jgi:hypothetical protein
MVLTNLRVILEMSGTRIRKWHLSRPLLTPPRVISITDNYSLADRLHRIAMRGELCAAPARQLDEIKGARPMVFLASRRLLESHRDISGRS